MCYFRHSTGKEEAGRRTADPQISPIIKEHMTTPAAPDDLAGNSNVAKTLRKHHSADRILLPLSQENLERRKQEKRRRHHSTAASGDRRWAKFLVLVT